MKRVFSLAVTLFILIVAAFSASAGSATATVAAQTETLSMSEEAFHTLSNSGHLSRSSYRAFNGAAIIHQNGYYYTYLEEMYGKTAVEVYESMLGGMTELEDGVFQALLDTTVFNGLAYDGEAFTARWDEVSDQVLAAMWCYRYDHPLACDRYSARVYCSLSYYYDDRTGKVTAATLVLYCYDHETYTDAMTATRDQKIREIAAQAERQESVYEALKYVHDYLVKNAYYDTKALSMSDESERVFLAHCSFGVLNTGRGVCESYAKAFKEICDQLSFPMLCTLMNSETHMWNAVRLDGKWYALDATWDDLDNIKQVRYDYFLCGDPDVVDGDSNSHTPNAAYTRRPAYEDTAYDPNAEATPHTCVPVIIPAKEATFDREGCTEGSYCGICHEVLTASVTVPKATATVTATVTASGVRIGWNATAGAEGYLVYRRAGAGTWEQLAAVTTLGYTDAAAPYGVLCDYAVQPYRGEVYGELFIGNAVQQTLATPTVKSANAVNGVSVSWNKITGAASYRVYRRSYGGGKWSGWQTLGNVTATSYTDKTAVSGAQYQYTVRAQNGAYLGPYQASATLRYLMTPTVKSANAVNGVSVSWNKAAGAASYRVYRRVYGGGKWSGWQTLGNVTATSYTDKTAVSGAQYQYTVRAQNGSAMSAYKAGTTLRYLMTPTVKSANAKAGVQLSWNKAAGATSYRVYRSVYSGGKWSGWQTLGNVTATAYTDKTAVSGVQYRYTVRAQNGSVMGAYKASATLKRLAQPAVTVKKATKGAKVSWNKVAGASGYRVYRRVYSGGKWSGWQTLGNVTTLTYTDKTAKAGTYYQYTVRAYSGSAMSSYQASTAFKR